MVTMMAFVVIIVIIVCCCGYNCCLVCWCCCLVLDNFQCILMKNKLICVMMLSDICFHALAFALAGPALLSQSLSLSDCLSFCLCLCPSVFLSLSLSFSISASLCVSLIRKEKKSKSIKNHRFLLWTITWY